MAIIVATVDTEKEELTVSIDGKKIKDACHVSMCCYLPYDNEKGEEVCHVCVTCNVDGEDGLNRSMTITKAGVEYDKPQINYMTKAGVDKAMRDISNILHKGKLS